MPAGKHVDQTQSQCDDTGVQVDVAPAWPVWRRRRDDECRADGDDVDESTAARVSPQYTLYLTIEELGVLVGVRRHAVIQPRA